MDGWVGRVALVTGASSGIGAGIVQLLVREGMTVIGVARSVDRIQALVEGDVSGAKGRLIPMKCDVSNEDDIKSVFAAAKSHGGIDVCINNAGLNHSCRLLSGVTHEWREMINVNVLGPCIITREFMRQLKERKVDDGHIIMINSIVGHKTPSTRSKFYSATKFAITALTEGIRQELREMKSNCRVTSISPGLVRTEFFGRATKAVDIEASKEKYKSLVYTGEVLEAGDIARAVVFALSCPPRMEINEMIVRPTGQKF
jgi:NADP-dependent 3-hydroxy acid dehydrogenase YdfG